LTAGVQVDYYLDMTHSDMTDRTKGRVNWPLLDRQDEGFRLAHRWLIPPGIRLDGAKLCYDEFQEDASPKWVMNPSVKLLADFVGLADAPPGEIERYAKRWGVLGFCQHQADQNLPLVMGHQYHRDLGNEPCRLVYAEAFESWRWYARLFRALLDQAAMLRKRRRLRPNSKRADDELGEFIRHCDWIACYFGCLRPILVVENGKLDIKLGGRFLLTGLPAALTTQLLFTLAGVSKFGTCASCGRLFPVRRQPRKGENSYCPNCGIRAAWREAQRRRRKKPN
jgi:predicted RNA-binding Zn-ribbon protein involved in translation (DUF1610 family)